MTRIEQNLFAPPGRPAANHSHILRRIRSISNPYVGNKKKLIGFLDHVLTEQGLEYSSVLDAFSGSAVVSMYFKGIGKKIIANDLLSSSFLNAVCLVENPGAVLDRKDIAYLLGHANPNATDFVRSRWQKSFTPKEAGQLDNFRANVRELASQYAQSLSQTFL